MTVPWPDYGEPADIIQLRNAVQSLIDGRFTDRARAAASAVQGMDHATEVRINYSSGEENLDGMWDPATPYRLTAVRAGTYAIEWTPSWAASAAGSRIALLKRNGVNIASSTLTAGFSVPIARPHTSVLPLSAGDYVELWLYQSSGGSLNTHNQPFPYLSISRVGA